MIVEYSFGGIITIWKISVCVGWHCIHAVGGLIDGTPVVCGGYPWRKKCFTITKTSADFMSTQKRYNGYAGSGIVFNDQGQQKVSPIFKIVA